MRLPRLVKVLAVCPLVAVTIVAEGIALAVDILIADVEE